MKTSEIIKTQLPEHIVSDAPLFVAFVDAYYKYVDNVTQGHGQIQNSLTNSDIDLCDESFVDEFYQMYASNLPREVAMDRRNFIKILRSIHEASGTEKALRLAFQAIFNETVKVSFPGESRLKTSDGIWVREKYITLETKFGSIPDGAIKMSFSNASGDFSFETTRTEIIGSTVRCYFQSYTKITFDIGQRVFHYDANGVMIYAGDLIKSPSYLSIVSPGKNWQVGQVVVIPGSNQNTIARVTSVNAIGGITGVEIVEYGNTHSDGQVITVSPYPNRPASSAIVVDSILTQVSPPIYSHTISITEYVEKLSESVVGVSNGLSVNSYFLENYVESYVGHNAFSQQFSSQSVSTVEDTGGLTIETWLASRATLAYQYGDVITLRGYYLNEQGQISNQTIKLQDNYFYQAFSYLIETSQDISQYESILNITHPAGSKSFSDLTKSGNVEITVTPSREITLPV
jgi:hypothetical protein